MIATRRNFLVVLLLAGLIASTARAEKIRTAVPGLNLNYLTVFSAEERKFFRDEGLDNETIVIGGPAGIAALVSGDVDYSGAGGSGLRAAVRGAPLKAILYQTEKPTWFLVVHPSITQASDLKGKKIAVALIGDSEDRFTTLFVERAGLSAKDVTKISVGTSIGDKILGLKSGSVAAAVLDPAATIAAEREGLRKLAYLGDMFPLPFQGYVTTQQKLSENSPQVKRWVRAMIRSLLFVRERPDDAADIAMRRLRIKNITKPMLAEAIRSYVLAFPQGIPGTPSAEGIKNILEYELRIPMKLDKPLAADNFFELRWAAEVRKEFESKSQ
ncbi:MAG TPA: ABC transporter substrate-binding protein [Candidatus Binatia bacterium]|jgi:ABC-type nitrate/sulfonate/bicarbonate transport system substrate-binding protein